MKNNNNNCGKELAKSGWLSDLRRCVKMIDKENNQDWQKMDHRNI